MKHLLYGSLLALSAMASPAFAQSVDEWAVPGKVVIDEVDDISAEDQAAVVSQLQDKFPDIRISPSSLEEDTKIEIASVREGEEDEVIHFLEHNSLIQHVERDYKVKTLGLVDFTPNDPEFSKQWHMTKINMPSAWGYSTGRGAIVAVIDTGVNCDLNDLKGHCIGGWNAIDNSEDYMDRQSHGSHCASTVLESTNNNLYGAGVAYDAKLLAVKVLGDDGSGTDLSVSEGIRWAADHGAQVLSLSLGGSRGTKVGKDAVDYALSKGVVIVAAAGNSSGPVGFPAAYPGVIAVSASTQDNSLASFSSYGPEVFIAAPGTDVVQTTICGEGNTDCPTKSYSGTSMSTPHVSGTAALLVSQGVTNPDAIKKRLRESATVTSLSKKNANKFGAGILNAGNAVAQENNRQAFWRILFGVVLSIALFRNSGEKVTWKFTLPALLVGCGLFFIPWIVAYPHPIVFALSRPLVEVLGSYSVRLLTWLPLANVLLPGLFMVLSWHWKQLRMTTAGICVGVASYLGSLLWMGTMTFALSSAIFIPWIVVNMVGCFMVARFNLKHLKAEKEEEPKA